MANMSNYLETQILNHLFRGTPYTAPATIYVALCTDTLDDTFENGSDLPEPSAANGYVRKPIASTAAKWSAPTEDGIIKNVEEVKWDKVQWEDTIRAVALCNAATGGKVLFWGDLSREKVVTQDDSISFAADSLSIQIDN